MQTEDAIRTDNIFIQHIRDDHFDQFKISVDVVRLDKIHPVVSGNKWFKLKYYLQQAQDQNAAVATFGGAFSNHIVATAYSCHQLKIKCAGFIRGEEPELYSPALTDAKAWNMQLHFMSRKGYRDKQSVIAANPSLFFIPEGGYGMEGAKGAAEIADLVPEFLKYRYIVGAVGTGTMMAGMANASLAHQQCVGISVMKNNYSLREETLALIHENARQRFSLHHDYHFGGYAKYTEGLIVFINKMWRENQLPLDFVYTAKALYAVYDLASKNYFEPSSKILFIHSGGLQGNRSLEQKIRFDS
jgi:1-aminocyclopropane-1-carboxylate deaminase/D-cysteine desulfhydrase-like pyridoxal-dependent ACC family enzyme